MMRVEIAKGRIVFLQIIDALERFLGCFDFNGYALFCATVAFAEEMDYRAEESQRDECRRAKLQPFREKLQACSTVCLLFHQP